MTSEVKSGGLTADASIAGRSRKKEEKIKVADQQKNQPQNNNGNKEQDLGQLLKIRREKLLSLIHI